MTENEQAGTPAPTQDGGTASAAGTPAGGTEGGTSSGLSDAEKQELESLRSFRDQALGEKGALNEARERIRELESQRFSHQPPTGVDPQAQQAAEAIRTLYDRDPDVAQALLGMANLTQQEFQRRDQEFQRREQKARYDRELAAVPAERRAEVERIAKTENVWPSIADDRVVRHQYEKERNDLAEQRRRLQEREDALKRGVVKTTAEPAPPPPNSDFITPEQYRDAARRAVTGDPDARKVIADYDAGRTKIRSG